MKFVVFGETITFWGNFSIVVFDLIIEAVVFHNRFLEFELMLQLTNKFIPIFRTKGYAKIFDSKIIVNPKPIRFRYPN